MPDRIRAEYLARLSTPIEIGADLGVAAHPMVFTYDAFRITVRMTEPTPAEYVDCPELGVFDFLSPAVLHSLHVSVAGEGSLIRKDDNLGIDPVTKRHYEQVCIGALKQFVTWVRVITNQGLNDRFPVWSYDAQFYTADGRIVESIAEIRPDNGFRLRSYGEFNFYGDFSESGWQTVANGFGNNETPKDVKVLKAEAESLLSSGYHNVALIVAVSTLEYACKEILHVEKKEGERGEFPVTKLVTNAEKLMKDSNLVDHWKWSKSKKIIQEKRNTNTHRRRVDVSRDDVELILHIVKKILSVIPD